MKKALVFSDSHLELVIGFILCVLLITLLSLMTAGHVRRIQDETMCQNAGYLGYDYISDYRVCVGIRDGKTVYVSVDDVRERMGE